jgi:pimeloyl-ACP methyl ester carboxylesterase
MGLFAPLIRAIHPGLFLGLGLLALGPCLALTQQQPLASPPPPGEMVDLGGHRLHFHCTGKGSPTVVIEGGFDEFSFDWVFVQPALSATNRVCTYDRAGYAWSDTGPKPRTLAQLNLELHDALAKLGERGPFVLVGHEFGAPILRNYFITYPNEVAGIVFVDAMSEDDRFEMWNKAVLKRDGAKGRTIPTPRENMVADDHIEIATFYRPGRVRTIEPPFDRLPPDIQTLHLWAQALRSFAAAEEAEREWAPEYFARWHNDPGADRLGSIPLIVLTRSEVGFHDLDFTAAQQESERKQNQVRLAALSTNCEQRVVAATANIMIENPSAVIDAIRKISPAVQPSSAEKSRKRE